MKGETMDKLRCDICGGILTMQSNGKTAVCDSCGMQYSVERLREKVQEIKGTVSVEGTVQTQDADFIVRGGVLERYNGNDTDVVIPDSVVKIGEKAFERCPGIRNVTMPDSVIEIDHEAFILCEFLEKVKFSYVLEKIGHSAFYGCRSLKKVSLPETVKEIGYDAFRQCTNLESINIPDRLEGLLYKVFLNCPALREVIISEEKKKKLFDLRSAQAAFEGDDPSRDSSAKDCGPWYLNLKPTLLEEEHKRIQEKWKEENKCQYCGGSFTGVLFKKCTRCHKPKDY